MCTRLAEGDWTRRRVAWTLDVDDSRGFGGGGGERGRWSYQQNRIASVLLSIPTDIGIHCYTFERSRRGETTRQIYRGSAQAGSRLGVELEAQRPVGSGDQATVQLCRHYLGTMLEDCS